MRSVTASIAAAALVGSLTLLGSASRAQQTVNWATWTNATSSSALGTITVGSTTVDLRYSGEVDTGPTELNGVGTNHWLPTTSFTGTGLAPGNAPIGGDMIALVGGTTTIDTITFSTPITNPYIALWSVGANGSPITYNFSAPLTLVAGGPNAEYGGGALTQVSSNVVSGQEGNGVALFQGTFTSISWTVPTAESYHGFTVGVAGLAAPSAAPEPSALALLLPALPLLGGMTARRLRRSA